jgi:hypothetical protein
MVGGNQNPGPSGNPSRHEKEHTRTDLQTLPVNHSTGCMGPERRGVLAHTRVGRRDAIGDHLALAARYANVGAIEKRAFSFWMGDVCLTSVGGRFIKQAQNELKFPA